MNTEVIKAITTLAQQTDILIFGEVHGTQEVPQVISNLLKGLQPLGYGALGLEIPYSEQEPLRRWAIDEAHEPPQFFMHPLGDGRGNEQVLTLVRNVINSNWHVLCFDGHSISNWKERDRIMAESLLTEWARICPDEKVVCICGNLHSRLSPSSHNGDKYWPSFAANLQFLKPNVVYFERSQIAVLRVSRILKI